MSVDEFTLQRRERMRHFLVEEHDLLISRDDELLIAQSAFGFIIDEEAKRFTALQQNLLREHQSGVQKLIADHHEHLQATLQRVEVAAANALAQRQAIEHALREFNEQALRQEGTAARLNTSLSNHQATVGQALWIAAIAALLSIAALGANLLLKT